MRRQVKRAALTYFRSKTVLEEWKCFAEDQKRTKDAGLGTGGVSW